LWEVRYIDPYVETFESLTGVTAVSFKLLGIERKGPYWSE